MRIVTYLFGVKTKQMREDLTSEGIFAYLHKKEGRWCRPFTDKVVGTVLYLTKGDSAFCRSLIKPQKLASKEVTVDINQNDTMLIQIRLAIGGRERAMEINAYGTMLVEEMGMKVRQLKHIKRGFGDITYNDKENDIIVDVACADFLFDVEIIDIEKFKKAYLQGIGTHREYGCGMITVRKK